MSAEISRLDIEAARRRAERIRFHATNANEAMQSLQKLVHTARELEDHVTLGYASWTAYVRDIFGDEPLRLARDVRRELVAELADAGMSTRAIAPIVGVDQKTISNDLRREENSSPAPSDPFPAEQAIRSTYGDEYVDAVQAEGFTVNQSTGEIIDGPAITADTPIVEEHTVTEKVKTVTGLDGKTYKRAEPKAIPTGDDANRLNAIQASKAIGSALETLLGLTYTNYRSGMLTDWWPLGKDSVPPSQSELFTPSKLRHIAQGLTATATEMEAQSV